MSQNNSNLPSHEDAEEEERQHFQNVVNTFRCYKNYNFQKLLKTLHYINSLPENQKSILLNHKECLHKVRTCVEKNYEIIKLLLNNVAHVFENKDHSNDTNDITDKFSVSLYDIDKLHGVFKQIYREWSIEGEEERNASFKLILDELKERFSNQECKKDIKVLVPGAGLGRLAYEIAKRGYTCQGNEISLFMLFMSNFIINKCTGRKKYRIFPWIHQPCNHLKTEHQIKSATFPDINPADLPQNADFSIAAGSFIEIYKMANSWDSIVTCFFLDTAYNIVSYIETIWNILKPGGFWINLGPLLYHHADLPDQDSIELSYEEIRQIVDHFKFSFLKEDTNVVTPYCQNSNSMLTYNYKSVFFVCQKSTEAT